jgi:hypothetical protein
MNEGEELMKKGMFRQIVVVTTVIITIAINALANILPFNGLETGQISDKFQVYFVPSGYVFSIWGLIYIGLIAYAIFQALPSQRDNPRLVGISGLFILSSIANCAWIFLWHYELFALTLLAMFTLLVSLILIYLRLGIGSRDKVSTGETWSVRVPFSIYLGWITVATIANISDVLYFVNWSGWGVGTMTWTVIMLVAAVVIAALMAFTRRDVAYLLVLIWAFAGIANKFPSVPLIYSASLGAAIVVGLLVIFTLVIRRKA